MLKLSGSTEIIKTPTKAIMIPMLRRHPMVSPRKAILIKVAKGTPNWLTTEAAEASAFAKPMKRRAKCPDPIKKEIKNKVLISFGTGRKNGMSKSVTPKNLIAAKKIGGTAASNTTQRVITIFRPQTKQTVKSNKKSLSAMKSTN